MPILQTRANAAAMGYGLFRSMGGGDGTIGIFAIAGDGSNVRNQYTYATDTSTATGIANASISTAFGSGAAGTNAFGIFQLGYNTGTGNYSSLRDKYTYATNTSAATTATSQNSGKGGASGNSTRGIFQSGAQTTATCAGTTVRNKFTYACSTSAVTTASSQASNNTAAAGNSTRGIFQLNSGAVGQSSNARNKFTYACDTSTGVGVAVASRNSSGGSGSAGNSTMGIFFIGSWCSSTTGSNERNKYLYASCTSFATTATNYAQTKNGSFGAGNSTRGIFNRGRNACCVTTTCRCKFTYATETTASAAASSIVSSWGKAASWALCVNT